MRCRWQYASDRFQSLLKVNRFRCNMSRKGNCWDNAPSENFFHTLKTELVFHEDFKTREQAQRAIFEFIEVFYNQVRLHSSNDYMSPADFELKQDEAASKKWTTPIRNCGLEAHNESFHDRIWRPLGRTPMEILNKPQVVGHPW